mgnify:CR=1 FL=1
MSKTFRQSRRDKDYFDSSEYSDQEYKSKKQARKKEYRKQRYYDEFEDSYRSDFRTQKARY